MLFNATKPPFNDPRVRRAVAHAVKREDIVKAAFFGRGKPLEGVPIAEGTPWYDAELAHGWNYDPARAKALLAEAGFANGFSATLLATAQYGMHKDTAEVVQQHLAAVGIQCELQLPDWSTRVACGGQGQYDIAIHGLVAENNDPDGLTAADRHVAAAGLRALVRPAGAAHRRRRSRAAAPSSTRPSASRSTRTCSAPRSKRCRWSASPGARRATAWIAA